MKDGNREAIQETTAINWVRDGGSWASMVTAEDGRSGHIPDTLQNCNLKGFVDGLDAGCERKRSQGYLQDFCPEKMKGWNYCVLSGVYC